MSASSSPFSRARTWALRLALWTGPALLSTAETYVMSRLADHPMPLWRAAATQMPSWYVWVLATPALEALAARLPLGRGMRLRAVAVHVLTALVLDALFAATYVAARLGVGPSDVPAAALLWRAALGWLPVVAFTYLAVQGVTAAFAFARRSREAERREAALSLELAQARLSALQAQLQPHFLFNTLNAIVGLLREEQPQTAVRMLVLLSDVLRDLLARGAHSVQQEVPLRDEVTWLERYLQLYELRFSDRLRVQWDVAPEALGAAVPALVLQPLVENALHHGIARRASAGRVVVRARLDGEALVLQVEDDGPGPTGQAQTGGSGLGLANTRARLAHLYGGRASLELGPRAGGGACATVVLPWREAPAHAPAQAPQEAA